MKAEIKSYIKHLFGFILLFFFALGVVSYANRDFELPFFVRGEDTAYLDDNFDDTENDYTTEAIIETTTEVIENLQNILDQENLAENNNNIDATQETTEEFALWSEELSKEGYEVTDGVYSDYTPDYVNEWKQSVAEVQAENAAIKEENTQIEKDNEKRSEKNKKPLLTEKKIPLIYEYKFVKLPLDYSKIPNIYNFTEQNIAHTVVEPFMDFYFVKYGEKKSLYTANGKLIIDDYYKSGMTMLMARDYLNRTVFQKVDKYYIYDPAKNVFSETEYNPVYGNRGINFMYPSYYGGYGLYSLERAVAENGRWGYYNPQTGKLVVDQVFQMSYNFSDKVAISCVQDFQLIIIDVNGNRTDTAYSVCGTFNENNLGYLYFDHGLTRANYKDYDRIAGTMTEGTAIIDKKGNRFNLPEDYTIKAYSNGMIMLEKGGKYGFMNYKGDWVIQPIFSYATPFYEGVAVVGLSDGKKALIDTTGNMLTKFHYNYISKCTGGIISLYNKEEGWIIINKVRKEANR